MKTLNSTLLMMLALLSLAACTGDTGKAAGKTAEPEPMAEVTNRIDVPSEVRRNLGITFVKVERRAVASTLRYPGAFELDPAARLSYGVLLAGEVSAHVAVNSRVKAGDLLATIRSPEAFELAKQVADENAAVMEANADIDLTVAKKAEAEAAIGAAQALAKGVEREAASLDSQVKAAQETTAFWEKQLAELRQQLAKGLAVADAIREAAGSHLESKARALELASARDRLAVELTGHHNDVASATVRRDQVDVETKVMQAKHAAALLRRDATLAQVGAMLGTAPIDPTAAIPTTFEIKAKADGIVTNAATTGQWLARGESVATVIEPSSLRLRIRIPVTDLARLKDVKLSSIRRIDDGSGASANHSIPGELNLLTGESTASGMVDALIVPHTLPTWASIGMAASAEIVIAGGDARLSVPVRATIRDGLEMLAFVRDPANPDKVIRQSVTLGASDGAWVVIDSGVGPDDEVVLDGIYELKLTGGGKAEAGGHFHADGTFHAGADH